MDVIVVVMDSSNGPVQAEAVPSMFDPPVLPSLWMFWTRRDGDLFVFGSCI